MLSMAICFLSGAILSLAFPRAGWHWTAWFALTPLMYCTFRLTWTGALLCGLAFGVGYFGSLLYWISIFGKLPWAALVVFQALFIVGFVIAARLLGSRLGPWGRFAFLPALWVVFEWLRSLGIFGFTWGDIGYSQSRVLPLIQMASVAGVSGVSLILAISNSALSSMAVALNGRQGMGTSLGHLAVAGLTVAVLMSFGRAAVVEDTMAGREVRAAVVQGNINPDIDGDVEYRERTWRVYSTLTHAAARERAELIVWPEAAVPGCAGRDPYIQQRLGNLAGEVGALLLAGGRDESDDRSRTYNSAFLIGPGLGVQGRYSKVHLVPFGEYVLWREYLPFLRYYRVTPFDLSPGSRYNTMHTGSYRIGTTICFESIFPGISRRLTASGAELLCIITNDSWFGRTPAAEQHMSISVFRAVENRRYVLHGAATGVSAIIDPFGRIVERTELCRPVVICSEVHLRSGRTLYTRYGDWLSYACIALVVLLSGTSVRRRCEKVGIVRHPNAHSES